MALEMQNFEALSPPVVKKITWWTLMFTMLDLRTQHFKPFRKVPLSLLTVISFDKLLFFSLVPAHQDFRIVTYNTP